jgi:asparagine synthase (glutamine-hydrolysing)
MCGIAGYVGTRPRGDGAIDSCLELLHRRGPDHAGATTHTLAGDRVAQLLSTRLDIIDLTERANQPLRVGSKTIVYNGELYNYRELRAELERDGEQFSSESDTEVLVRALARWGVAGLDRCEGMWAFALHDADDGSVTLCRDRFGEKPLWLHRSADGLTFASEPKGVFALLGRRLEPDLEQVRRYLVTGYRTLWTDDDRSFFRGLELLPAATVLRIERDGGETRQRYWAPSFDPDEAMSYEEAVAGVRAHVLRTVELRLRADVPVAFCMSGGVDSTSLIAAAKKICGYDVHGFTVVNEDARYDEREAVAASVAALALRHTQVPLEQTAFLPRMRDLVRYHDAPVATISYYVHWRLMEGIANGGYRVSVSGTAADELLTGYYDHHLAYLAQVRELPELHAASVAAWEREIRPLVRNPHLGDPELFVRDPGFRGHIVLDADAFAGFLVDGYRPEPFRDRPYSDDLLRSRMLNELVHETVPVILQEDDLNSMYWSVENRSPYLDRPLAEFSYRIPTRHLVRDGRAKAVLRDAMRGIAPDHVLDEPRKVGFNAPIEALLDLDDADVRAELLADSPIFDVVRRDRIEELLDERDLPNSRSKFLFSFVSSKLFLEEHTA